MSPLCTVFPHGSQVILETSHPRRYCLSVLHLHGVAIVFLEHLGKCFASLFPGRNHLFSPFCQCPNAWRNPVLFVWCIHVGGGQCKTGIFLARELCLEIGLLVHGQIHRKLDDDDRGSPEIPDLQALRHELQGSPLTLQWMVSVQKMWAAQSCWYVCVVENAGKVSCVHVCVCSTLPDKWNVSLQVCDLMYLQPDISPPSPYHLAPPSRVQQYPHTTDSCDTSSKE